MTNAARFHRALTTAPQVLALVVGLLLTGAAPSHADTNPAFTSNFEITCCLNGRTKFTVHNDGRVDVWTKANVAGDNRYWLEIQRENCGFWGCNGYVTVSEKWEVRADGAWRFHSFLVGNSGRLHHVRITKVNNGIIMRGTIEVS